MLEVTRSDTNVEGAGGSVLLELFELLIKEATEDLAMGLQMMAESCRRKLVVTFEFTPGADGFDARLVTVGQDMEAGREAS